MNIIIAEKPKVASKISYALSHLGKAKRMSAYGVSLYKIGDYIIIPAAGHIFGIKAKNSEFTYPVLEYEWKPTFEISKQSSFTKKFYYAFVKYKKYADDVIVATDFDMEGSLIGYNIVKYIFNKKPLRMKFSSLTPLELKKAFENPIEFDYNNAIAGETRHELDWLYGINLSRAIMIAIRKHGYKNVLSIGRIQGPTLALVYKKQKEIEEFKPQPYWVVYALVNNEKFIHVEEKFNKKELAERVKQNSLREGFVEKIINKDQTIYPKPAFDLSTLQQEAYKHLKFSPTKTLNIAQELYENSYISYPRTSSQKLPPTIGYKNILEKLKILYEEEVSRLLAKSRLYPVQGKKKDPAHPAIYPTGIIGDMTKEQKQLYDLIARRFMAAFGDEAIITTTKVIINANEKYYAEGKIIKKEGFLSIYHFSKPKTKQLNFEENQKVRIEKIIIEKKMTKPPARYNEASLIKELEKRNLGTKTTRALIVHTLFTRKYFLKKRGILITPLGKAIEEVFEKYVPEILSEELTRSFEEKLEKIQQNKLKKEEVIKEAKEIIKNICDEFKIKEYEIGKELVRKIKELSYSKKKR